jgi:O-antigen ligase
MKNILLILFFSSILTFFIYIKPRLVFTIIFGISVVFYYWYFKQELFFVGGAKIYLNDIAMLSLSIYIMLTVLVEQINLSKLNINKYIVLFLLWGLMALLRGFPHYGHSAFGEARWYVLPIIYYLSFVIMFKGKDEVWIFLKAIIVIAIITILVNILDYYVLGGLSERLAISRDFRVNWRFISSHQALILAQLLISLLMLSSVGEVKILYTFALTLVVTPIILITQHRSVWIATVFGIFYFVLIKVFWPRQTTANFFLLTILGIIISLGCIIFLANINTMDWSFIENIELALSFLRDPMDDPTGGWRLIAWEQELENALNHPFFGSGFGGYSYWFDGNNWLQVPVHNGYLMFFSKLGLVGLLIFMATLITWNLKAIRFSLREKQKKYVALAVSLHICLLMYLIFAVFYQFSVYFWILIAIGTVLNKEDGQTKSGAQFKDDRNKTSLAFQ